MRTSIPASFRPAIAAFLLAGTLGLRPAGSADDALPGGFADRIEVTEVTISVAVVDRDGAPIRDLRRDEVRLAVDGVETAITGFAAARVAPAAAPAPEGTDEGASAVPRYLTLFLNDRGGSAQERGRALRQLEEVLPRLQADGWRVAITAIDTALHTVQTFADDPAPAAARLRERAAVRVQPSPIAAERQALLRSMDDVSIGLPGKDDGTSLAMDSSEARGTLQRIRALGRSQRQQGKAMAALLTSVVEDMARLPGERALVYVGEGFEAQPITDLLLQWSGRYPSVAATQMRKPELETGQYSLVEEVDALSEAAAAADVTVYYVPTVTWASGASIEVDREGAEATSDVVSSSRRALGDAVAGLARASGGARLATGRRGLERLADDLGSRYAIAFVPPATADRGAHRVKVLLSRPGVRIRHRESFRLRSVAQRLAETTVAALARGDGDNPLAAAIEQRGAVARSDGSVDLSLAVTLPLRSLALVPGREAHRGEVTVFYCAAEPGGGAVEVRTLTFPVVVDNNSLFTTLRREASFPVAVTAAPAGGRVAVTVLDGVAQTTSTVTLTVGAGAGPG